MRQKGMRLPTQEEEQAFRVASVKWFEDWANKQPEDWQRAKLPALQKMAANVEAGRVSLHLLSTTWRNS